MVIGIQQIFEINFTDETWMIQLGKLSLRAEKIVLKNFAATSVSMPYVKAILTQNNLYISSWEDDLVIERCSS
ncbi:MAG: hypothetical protein H0X66_20375 [Verrucomicrobia bacterium]|nr:hypothetical protein [Verrucomicrobiota bacterium]